MLKAIFFSFILLFISSCSDGSPDPLPPSGQWVDHDEIRKISCTNTNFNHGFLSHENIINLFQCFEWDKSYPSFFYGLKEIPSEDWNHLWMPVDQHWFSNLGKREAFFRAVNNLDKKNGLEDISVIIGAFLEDNFYDAIAEIFKHGSKGETTIKASILSSFELLNLSETESENLVNLFEELRKTIMELDDGLPQTIQANLNNPHFEIGRKTFINSFLNVISSNQFSASSSSFWPILLSNQNIFALIKNEQFTVGEWNYILDFPYSNGKDVPHDYRYLSRYLLSPHACGELNHPVAFVIKREVEDINSKILSFSHESFYEEMKSYGLDFVLGDYTCGWSTLRQNEQSVDSRELLLNTLEFLSSPWRYELIKNVLKVSGDKRVTSTEFINILGASLFESWAKWSSSFDSMLRLQTYKAMKNFSFLGMIDARNFLEHWLVDSKVRPYQGLSQIWQELAKFKYKNGLSGQDYVLRVLDTHFSEEVNFKLVFEFYHQISLQFRDNLHLFTKEWFSKEENRLKTFQAIENISTVLKGKDVLKDLKLFFSRNQIVELVGIVSRNMPIAQESIVLPLRNELVLVPSSFIYSDDSFNTAYRCIKNILDIQIPYSTHLDQIEGCEEGEMRTPTALLFNWFSNLTVSFDKTKKSNVNLQKGLLSSSLHQTFFSLQTLFAQENLLEELLERNRKLWSEISDEQWPLLMENFKNYILEVRENSSWIEAWQEVLNKVPDIEISLIKNLFTLAENTLLDMKEQDILPVNEPSLSIPDDEIDILFSNLLPLVFESEKPGHSLFTHFVNNLSGPQRLSHLFKFIHALEQEDSAREVKLYDSEGKTRVMTLTMAERLDMLMEVSSIQNNRLAVYWINDLAQSKNFSKSLRENYKLIGLCVKPITDLFCPKMNQADKINLKNIIALYPVLMEIEALGLNIQEMFQEGIRALFESSPNNLSKSRNGFNFPYFYPQASVSLHRSQITKFLAESRLLTPLISYIRERIGHHPQDLISFLESEQLVEIQAGLFSNFNQTKFQSELDQLISYQEKDLYDDLSFFITWYANLSAKDKIYMERSLGLGLQLLARVLNQSTLGIQDFLPLFSAALVNIEVTLKEVRPSSLLSFFISLEQNLKVEDSEMMDSTVQSLNGFIKLLRTFFPLNPSATSVNKSKRLLESLGQVFFSVSVDSRFVTVVNNEIDSLAPPLLSYIRYSLTSREGSASEARELLDYFLADKNMDEVKHLLDLIYINRFDDFLSFFMQTFGSGKLIYR